MTQDTARKTTVVVTGATGRTGGRVARAAEAAGLTVRAASRGTGFDWSDPSTWAEVLRGADAAYLAYPTDIGAPEAAGAVGRLAGEAVACGVRRLVLLSARGEERARPAEEALRASGADWTIVRAAWFTQNFSEGPLAEELRLGGGLVFPAADAVREPFVDARDIADVVVAALTSNGRYAGRVIDVTGPRLLTWGEAVAEIGAAAGRELSYRAVPAREYRAHLTGFGVPAEEADFLIDLFEELLDGRNAHLSDGVERVLGRKPHDFTAFAKEAAEAGAWS
ncbi:NAD(P)H-binding protein [Streptomyces sp. A012304]|uniref:NmrA family NAD(P)-binding protein n=1 Tax=Streptomyces sp. A012304 TaxID=375446 RepID=UPI00222FB797|nr:NAD(P)H-binding protein [Streptomyces sp. A012304]